LTAAELIIPLPFLISRWPPLVIKVQSECGASLGTWAVLPNITPVKWRGGECKRQEMNDELDFLEAIGQLGVRFVVVHLLTMIEKFRFGLMREFFKIIASQPNLLIHRVEMIWNEENGEDINYIYLFVYFKLAYFYSTFADGIEEAVKRQIGAAAGLLGTIAEDALERVAQQCFGHPFFLVIGRQEVVFYSWKIVKYLIIIDWRM
jgi:hypothetical protein